MNPSKILSFFVVILFLFSSCAQESGQSDLKVPIPRDTNKINLSDILGYYVVDPGTPEHLKKTRGYVKKFARLTGNERSEFEEDYETKLDDETAKKSIYITSIRRYIPDGRGGSMSSSSTTDHLINIGGKFSTEFEEHSTDVVKNTIRRKQLIFLTKGDKQVPVLIIYKRWSFSINKDGLTTMVRMQVFDEQVFKKLTLSSKPGEGDTQEDVEEYKRKQRIYVLMRKGWVSVKYSKVRKDTMLRNFATTAEKMFVFPSGM